MKTLPTWLRLAVLGAAALTAPLRAQTDSDEKVMAEINRKSREIQQRIVGTDDLNERAKLQAELATFFEKSLVRLSPKSRPMAEIGVKLIRPLQDEGAAYTQAVATYFGSPEADLRTIKARAEIPARVKKISELAAMNAKLIERINALDADAVKLLAKSSLSERDQAGFMQGFRQSAGRNMGALRAIRSLDAKMFVLWHDALQLLERAWGRWHADGEQPLKWDDAEGEKKLAAIIDEINVLAERQAAAERSLLERK